MRHAERPGIRKQQALRDSIARAQGFKDHTDAESALATAEKVEVKKSFPEVLPGARMVFFVMQTRTNSAGAYQALIAVEGEQGFHLTDWFWGTSYEVAQQIAEERNTVQGISPKESIMIQLSTMRL